MLTKTHLNRNKYMYTITIIGKNSKLYKSLDTCEFKNNFNIIELSHSEVFEINELENPVIFSFSKNSKINYDFLDMVLSKSIGRIVYVSSIAAEVYEKHGFYKYPKIKYSSEKKIFQFSDSVVLRVGIVESLHDINNSFNGKVKLTSNDIIISMIHNVFKTVDNEKIINCWESTYIKGKKLHSIIFNIQKKIYKFSPFVFFICRPFGILYRFIGYKNYGYTFIANQLNKLC